MLVAQLCPTLRDSMDCSPPGSSVHGIRQARKLEWVAFPFPEDSPNQGIKLASLTLQVDFLLSEPSISEERKLKIFTQVGSKIAMKQWLLSEKAIAPHSSTLAWKIPWMEEPGRLQSMRSQRVGHN